MFVKLNKNGSIHSWADWEFPESVWDEREIVMGYDMQYYFKGTEPEPPQPAEPAQPITEA